MATEAKISANLLVSSESPTSTSYSTSSTVASTVSGGESYSFDDYNDLRKY